LPNREQFAVVGKVIKPHGIKGELIVEPSGDPAEIFKAGQTLRIMDGSGDRVLTVEKCQPHQDRLILALAGLRTRNEAEGLRGRELVMEVERLAPLREHEAYFFEILDAAVVDPEGREIGRVISILEIGEGHLLEIASPAGEFYLPFVEEYIRGFHRGNRTLTVANHEELLHLND